MTDAPIPPDDDPFGHLPPQLRALFDQLGGSDLSGLAPHLAQAMHGMHQPTQGTVDFALARRVALEVAGQGDRAPSDAERTRAAEAFALAEHWLDTTGLPSPADAGTLVIGNRSGWIDAALGALRPLIVPVTEASIAAMTELAREQFAQLDVEDFDQLGITLPEGFGDVLRQLAQGDIGAMLQPAGAMMAGLQVGQVIGKLARQLHGQYDLGIPTAPTGQAHWIAPNITETFDGFDLDATEVAIMIATTEAAYRRIFHAVNWLEAHLHALVAEFARGIEVDAQRLEALTDELMLGVDPENPDELRQAMEKAAQFRLEPTPAQTRTLERLQTIVSVTGAWARLEARRAVGTRLPERDRVEEVLRRRRATQGDGESQLAALLGLDLRPRDDRAGDVFVAMVDDTLGPTGLLRVLAHPENLPHVDELHDPQQWLTRMSASSDIPDDISALFGDVTEAPTEASAAERQVRDAESDDGSANS